jgi:hypothetical protein
MAAQEQREQPAPRSMTKAQQAAHAGRLAKRQQAIERGELVSNAPLRARCEWLMDHDPEFSLVLACFRLADLGYPKFLKKPSGTKSCGTAMSGDTSHLLRVLGMRDLAPTTKGGRRYVAPGRTQWIPYELAVALARALHMDPVDAGV